MRCIAAVLFVLGTVTGSACIDSDAAKPELQILNEDLEELTCDQSDECELEGGEDSIIVRVTYDGLEFDEQNDAPAPTLILLGDDEELEVTAAIRQISSSPVVFQTGPISIPPRHIKGLIVRVEVEDGYSSESEIFSVSAPLLHLDASECPEDGSTCDLVHGVGTVHLVATSYAAPGETITILSRVGSADAKVVAEGQLVEVGDGVPNETLLTVDVPTSGAQWTLVARTATTKPSPPVKINLVGPEIGAEWVECSTANCTLARESIAHLVISAPLGLREPTARVRVVVDGGLTPTNFEVPLEPEGAVLSGTLTVALPEKGDALNARVYVGQAPPKVTQSIALVESEDAQTEVFINCI